VIYIRAIVLAGIFTAMVSCSTSGGTIGGLVPAPKILKGTIKDNVYTGADNSFSVAVPHKQGSNEYLYMHVKEEKPEYGTYVSFGPAAFDQSIYRLEIARRVTPSSADVRFDEVAEKVVARYSTSFQQQYGAELITVESRREVINGRDAFYWKMTQLVPAGKMSNLETHITHEVYCMNFDKAFALVWVQYPIEKMTPPLELAPRAFAESVSLN
jgi:hypothetical protein